MHLSIGAVIDIMPCMDRKHGFRLGGIKNGKRMRLNLTLKGEKGKWLRRGLYAFAAIIVVLVLARVLKPDVQLMNTPELIRITDNGVLTVGVRDDMPLFAEDGEGFEIEIARLFARYVLPDAPEGTEIKLVTVSNQTAATKLSDGSIDIAVALMQRGASSNYAYSYSYFTDTCGVLVKSGGEDNPLEDMLIGYVQGSSGARVLTEYTSARETKVERTLLDRLLGRQPQLPADAIKYDTKAFASYPDLISALKNGRIDGSVLTGAYLNKYKDEFARGFAMHNIELGEVEYAIACAADEAGIARLADMFIYELKQNGELDALLQRYSILPYEPTT